VSELSGQCSIAEIKGALPRQEQGTPRFHAG